MSLGSDWSSGFSNGAAAVNSGLANARQMLQWKEEQDRKRKLEELARENAGIGRTRTVQKDVEYPYNDQETRQWTPDTDPTFTANAAQAYRDFGEEGLRSLEGSYGMPANTIRHQYDTGTYGLGRVPAVEQGLDTETDVVSPHGSWKVRLDERQPGGSLPPLRDTYPTDGYKQGITKLVPKTGIAQVAATEQVPASERYAQMAQNAAARGLYAEAEKYSLLADKTAIDEEKLGWDRKRFGWDEADRGDVLQERKLRMDQVRQQLELGQITVDGKKRDEVIKTELGKLAKVGSWDALVKLADPDTNDGIEVTYQEVQMGKGKGVLLMYGDKPLFPQPFSSLDDAKKMIQQGITGNPDLYYAFKTAEDDRALKNAQTQSEINKNNAMANNYNAEAGHTRAGKPGAGAGAGAGGLALGDVKHVMGIAANAGQLWAKAHPNAKAFMTPEGTYRTTAELDAMTQSIAMDIIAAGKMPTPEGVVAVMQGLAASGSKGNAKPAPAKPASKPTATGESATAVPAGLGGRGFSTPSSIGGLNDAQLKFRLRNEKDPLARKHLEAEAARRGLTQ